MYILFAILSFSWFISFSVLNVESLEWGLQTSWFLCILFSIYFVALFLTKKHLKISFNIYDAFFLVIFFITIFDYLLLDSIGVNTIRSFLFDIEYEYSLDQLKKRSIPHLLYIIFLWFCIKNIYAYFSYYKNICHIWIKKYFITFPFFFVGLWAIYQWFSTYDIVPYVKIFNNNISTGFTYLRFKDSHRTSSIFPEPSEYAYFLAFYLPIVLSYSLGGRNMFSLSGNKLLRICVFVFYFLQVILCKSMSYFLMFPVILLYSINTVIKGKRIMLNIMFCFLVIIFGVFVYLIYGERLLRVVSGIDSSMLIRLGSLYGGFALFIASPITGVGYGAIRGVDLFSFLLACFGLVGTLMLIFCMHKLRKIAKNNNISELFYHSFVSLIFMAMVSNPVLEHISIWIILAVIVFFGKKRPHEIR